MYTLLCTHLSLVEVFGSLVHLLILLLAPHLLVFYKTITLRSLKMTKIPLGISKYFNIMKISYFIKLWDYSNWNYRNRTSQTQVIKEMVSCPKQAIPHGACGICLGLHTGRVDSTRGVWNLPWVPHGACGASCSPKCAKNLIFAIQLAPIALILYTRPLDIQNKVPKDV